jgi:hypothetical protein
MQGAEGASAGRHRVICSKGCRLPFPVGFKVRKVVLSRLPFPVGFKVQGSFEQAAISSWLQGAQSSFEQTAISSLALPQSPVGPKAPSPVGRELLNGFARSALPQFLHARQC